jgi:antitoxin component YwqK of YwqJK toxin-antitoxin module
MKNEDEKNEHIKFVTVFKTGDPAFISFAKSLLEAEGIIYYFKGEGLQNIGGAGNIGTGYNQLFGPVEIQVDEKDAQKAKEMLEQNEQAKFVMPDYMNAGEKTEKDEECKPADEKKVSFKGIFWGILIGIILAVTFNYIYKAIEKYRQNNLSSVDKLDNNKDGKTDVIYYYENGALAKIEDDRNYDGKIDQKSFYKNDIIDHVEADNNYDGVFEIKTYYKNGITSHDEFDLNNDGKPEAVANYIDGVIYDAEYYHESTHKICSKILYQNGIISEERIDLDGDGKFETLLKYNEYGRLISITRLAK